MKQDMALSLRIISGATKAFCILFILCMVPRVVSKGDFSSAEMQVKADLPPKVL